MNKVAKESKIQQRNEQLSKELKRLETDVYNLSKGLNEELLALNSNHDLVREVYRSNELYYIILGKSLVQHYDLERSVAELEAQKNIQVKLRNQFYAEDYKRVKEEYDKQRKCLLQKISDDKSLDRNFRKNMVRLSGEAIDQATLNILYQLFLKREGDCLEPEVLNQKGYRKTQLLPNNNSKLRRHSGSNADKWHKGQGAK